MALGIAGNVTATTGNVYLANSSAGGITFGAFTIASVAGGTVGLQTNALANLGVTGATGQRTPVRPARSNWRPIPPIP